jgi:hypothetical protein
VAAVIKAILTDTEARGDAPASATFGHLREPALFITAALRNLRGKSDGVLPRSASSNMGEPIYSAASVFNFYPPSFVLPGTQTLAPEFGIDDASTALARANFVNTVIIQGGATADPTVTGSTGTYVDLTALSGLTDPTAQISQLNTTLMHGTLSSAASATILTALQAQATPLAQARTAAYLMLTSAQYQVER